MSGRGLSTSVRVLHDNEQKVHNEGGVTRFKERDQPSKGTSVNDQEVLNTIIVKKSMKFGSQYRNLRA
jgi:hypothetical protein